MMLSKYPLCAECLRYGRTEPATEVHHIVARRNGGRDVEENLMSLCKSCHSRITMNETRQARA